MTDINIGDTRFLSAVDFIPLKTICSVTGKPTYIRSEFPPILSSLGGLVMGKDLYRFMILLMLGAFIYLLAGCNSILIPEEKRNYVGTWEGVGFHLTITDDGSVDYRRVKGNSRKTVTGPVKSFEGDDFVVGVLFITTTFEVQHPPYKDGDEWLMVVDGVELIKVAGPIT
jgi:hypothetical protein